MLRGPEPEPDALTSLAVHGMRRGWSWLLVLSLLMPVFGERLGHVSEMLDLAGHFLMTSTSFSLVCAVLFGFFGRRAEAVASLAIFIAGCLLLRPWLAPIDVSDDAKVTHSALLLNVYYDNQSLEQLDAWVRARDADIVILLEVKPHVWTKLQGTVSAYPYRIDCWKEKSCDALVLSKFPLSDRRSSLPISPWRQPFSVSQVQLHNGVISLFTAHLSLPAVLEGEDKHEFDALSEAISRAAGPKLVLGDFNASPWTAKMKDLAGSTGLGIATGLEATWPSLIPSLLGIPIDHALASDGLSIHARTVHSVPGSDHRAVEVRFSLAATGSGATVE